MKRLTLTLMSISTALAIATTAAGCTTDPDQAGSSLGGTTNREIGATPGSTTGDTTTTVDHSNDSTGDTSGNDDNGTNTKQKVSDETAVGSADIVARLHACGKMPVTSLQKFLETRGVGAAAMGLFNNGKPALQDANFGARIPEAAFGSTASYAKMYDVFVAAAADIRMGLDKSTACPGVFMVDPTTKKLTKGGISCITGIPVSDSYVDVANLQLADATKTAVAVGAKDAPAVAAEITIAAILTAAHVCN